MTSRPSRRQVSSGTGVPEPWTIPEAARATPSGFPLPTSWPACFAPDMLGRLGAQVDPSTPGFAPWSAATWAGYRETCEIQQLLLSWLAHTKGPAASVTELRDWPEVVLDTAMRFSHAVSGLVDAHGGLLEDAPRDAMGRWWQQATAIKGIVHRVMTTGKDLAKPVPSSIQPMWATLTQGIERPTLYPGVPLWGPEELQRQLLLSTHRDWRVLGLQRLGAPALTQEATGAQRDAPRVRADEPTAGAERVAKRKRRRPAL